MKFIFIFIFGTIAQIVDCQITSLSSVDSLLTDHFRNCAFEEVLRATDSIQELGYLDNNLLEGRLTFWRAKTYYELGQFDLCRNSLQNSIDIFRELPNSAENQLAACLLEQSRIMYEFGDPDVALFQTKRILSLEVISEDVRDGTRTFLAYLYSELGNQQKADSILNNLLSTIGTTIDSSSFGAMRIHGLAALFATRSRNFKDRYAHAIKSLQIAENNPETLPWVLLQAKSRVAGALFSQKGTEANFDLYQEILDFDGCRSTSINKILFFAWQNSANIHLQRRNIRLAIAHLNESLRLQSQTYSGDHLWKLGVINGLADSHARIYDTLAARNYAKQALEMARKLGSQKQEYEALFTLQRTEKELQTKIQLLNKAFDLAQKTFPERDYRIASTAISLTSAYVRAGNQSKALEYGTFVNNMMQKMGGHPIVNNLYDDLTEAAISKNDLESANIYLDSSFAELSNSIQIDKHIIGSFASASDLFFKHAKISQKQWHISGDPTELLNAREFLDQTIRSVEFMLPLAILPWEKQALADKLHQYYEAAIENSMSIFHLSPNDENQDHLFRLVEESRNIILRTHFRQKGSFVNEQTRENKMKLLAKVLILERKFATEQNSKVKEDLIQTKNELSMVEKQIQETGERADTQIPTLDSLQSRLQKDQLIVSYFRIQDTLFAFSIRKDDISIKKLCSGRQISLLVNEYRRLMTSFSQTSDKGANLLKIDSLSIELCDILIEPFLSEWIEDRLTNIRIIADHELHYLAFGSLKSRTGKYLIEYPFTISYNLSSLHLNSETSSQARSNLAFFSANYHTYKIRKNDTISFPSIAQLVRENILILPKSDEGQFSDLKIPLVDHFEGEEVTKKAFLESSANYKIVHLSMHGIIDSLNPIHSFLLFENPNPDDDPKMYLGELYERDFNNELVFLSACQSGGGPLSKGEGVLSFARAFQYSGVSSIITGLWNLPNHATSKITNSFYAEIDAGKDKATAIRNAKREYLRNQNEPILRHPYFWAGLILQGETGTIPLKGKSKKGILYLILGGLILTGSYFLMHRKRFKHSA